MWNFYLSTGVRSRLPGWMSQQMQKITNANSKTTTIHVYTDLSDIKPFPYDDSFICGLEFFDRSGQSQIRLGTKGKRNDRHVEKIKLYEDERVIGLKALASLDG